MLDEFDKEVGLHYLKAIHLNDSKGTKPGLRHIINITQCTKWCVHLSSLKSAGKLGCNLDRHEDIGKGHIGISAFRDIVNEPRLDNIPLILETPGR